MPAWPVKVLAAFVVFVLVGCSGSGGSIVVEDEAVDSSAQPESDEGQSVADDAALARRALLRLSDFPQGWVEQESDEEEDDESLLDGIEECDGLRTIDDTLSAVPEAKADFADSASGVSAFPSVSVLPAAAEAGRMIEIYQSGDVLDCYELGYTEFLSDPANLPPGAVGVRVGVTQIPVRPLGDQRSAVQVEVTFVGADGESVVGADGEPVVVLLQSDVVRVGRALAGIVGLGRKPLAIRDELMETMALRLESEGL